MPPLKYSAPDSFDNPTAMPDTLDQAQLWQNENCLWWDTHPMRYDWKEGIQSREFTAEFFSEVDHRFFSNVKEFMPWREIPFDALIDFHSLENKDVLEIGVGMGSHAQLVAPFAGSYTGIDITDYAVRSSSERLRLSGLGGTILRMDAEEMNFNDNRFDFVWSWGVIHHSSNPARIIREIHRVLKPGGKAVTMVYHRGFLNYYVVGGLFRGLLQGGLFKTGSLHRTIQLWTDGAIARFYSIPEWKGLVSPHFAIENILVFGSKSEIVPLPGGRIKKILMPLIPNRLGRLLTNHLKLGCLLVSILKKV